jgi:hypothetical protein
VGKIYIITKIYTNCILNRTISLPIILKQLFCAHSCLHTLPHAGTSPPIKKPYWNFKNIKPFLFSNTAFFYYQNPCAKPRG